MSPRKISVIGLGYVGLPVAVAFGQKSKVVGFDINAQRIKELKDGIDNTREVHSKELLAADILFTSSPNDLREADFHIVAVPTPIDSARRPDLRPIDKASHALGKIIKAGDIIVYESTVYPGLTEEFCVPILEQESGLVYGKDFFVGYSPERINPGDKEHNFTKIMKVVAGCNPSITDIIAGVYGSVVTAGVFKATSIKVAEAAKVIENTQRDLNIALMNELALIFDRMDIDTNEVIDAASTKWNFLKFKPGLVGGHCIGVDPYYLTFKAESLGYHPQVILAGRRINDDMGAMIGRQAVKQLILAGHNPCESTITVMGLTFKENCPDLRNSKVIDIIEELKSFNIDVQVCDPEANAGEALEHYDVELTPLNKLRKSQAVIVSVGHHQFASLTPEDFKNFLEFPGVVLDVKSLYPKNYFPADYKVWRL